MRWELNLQNWEKDTVVCTSLQVEELAVGDGWSFNDDDFKKYTLRKWSQNSSEMQGRHENTDKHNTRTSCMKPMAKKTATTREDCLLVK